MNPRNAIVTSTTPGDAVKAFREFLRVHPVGGRLTGFEKDEMALELARIALDFGKEPVQADALVAAARGRAKVLLGLSLSLLDTQTSPQAAMAHWLTEQEPPAGFSIDRECELKAADESKAVVRYGHHPLDIEEVRAHIQAGKLPTKLAMIWDDRVAFVLTEGLQLKKLAFLDTVFEGQSQQDEGGFDADVAIATGELSKLIADLAAALGGVQG